MKSASAVASSDVPHDLERPLVPKKSKTGYSQVPVLAFISFSSGVLHDLAAKADRGGHVMSCLHAQEDVALETERDSPQRGT